MCVRTCVGACVCLCLTSHLHQGHIETAFPFTDRVGFAQWLACQPLTRQVVSSPPGRVIPKTIIQMVQTASLHRHACVRVAAQLAKRPGSVWNCLLGHARKRSPGISCKSRVSYLGPGFLSSATWPLLPKKAL